MGTWIVLHTKTSSSAPVVAARVEVLQPCLEVDLARGEEEEDDDDELQHEDVGQAHADGEAVGLG